MMGCEDKRLIILRSVVANLVFAEGHKRTHAPLQRSFTDAHEVRGIIPCNCKPSDGLFFFNDDHGVNELTRSVLFHQETDDHKDHPYENESVKNYLGSGR